MSKLNQFRWASVIAGVLSGVAALIGVVTQLPALWIFGGLVLAVDIILIAIKTRCPFCRRSLPIRPHCGAEEYCRHCGGKVE